MPFLSKRYTLSCLAAAAVLSSNVAYADETAFGPGKVITEFGKIAAVETDFEIPKRIQFKILYDTIKSAEAGKINPTLNTAARFINMHAAAGVAEKT